jgi:hypothetical protein
MKIIFRAARPALITIAAAALMIASSQAATITVTTTADGLTLTPNNGSVSLREAMTAINAGNNLGDPDIIAQNPGDFGANDRINFSISGAGVRTITPASVLPTVTKPVVIDGYTQPGAKANTLAIGNNAVLLIELNGNGTIPQALTISAGASRVRGLVINRFDGGAILLQTAGGNTVEGNWLGISASGTTLRNNSGTDIVISNSLNNLIGGTSPAARNVLVGSSGNGALTLFGGASATIQGNYIGMNAQGTAGLNAPGGITIGTSGNLIGGTAPGARNVISGSRSLNIGAGIAATKNNIVQGNTFGLNASGTTALANNTGGVAINITPTNLADGNLIGGTAAGARNVFATSGTAIVVSGVAANVGANTIQGNYIGLNVAGTAAPVIGGSNRRGVLISDSNNHVIGGTAPGAGNVIASYGSGVEIYGSGNVVQGNFIGTNAAGTAALGNATGVLLSNNNLTGNNNTIGGSAPGAGNLISGNSGDGIRLSPGSGNLIQGNFIGTDVKGTGDLGNAGYGISMSVNSSNNTIGGTIAGQGNIIAFNGSEGGSSGGVAVQSGTGNSIRGNAIFSNTGNTGVGINLFGGTETTGVTANDSCDADPGANNLQNFPVIKSVTNTSGSVNITGTFNSAANTVYRLEFFRNAVVDPTGHGEGQVFLGFANVTTNASCNATFDLNFPTGTTALRVTATATDPLGNTSEFSAALGQLLNISTRLRVQTGDKVLIGGFIVTGNDPKKVLVRGIGPSLAAFFPDFLANPTLELFQGNTSLAINDDWKTRPDGSSQQAEIQATTIPPTNNLEAALVRTLPGNNAGYTAIVRGKNNTTGIGVVEAYDLDTAANSRLANISTRGLVETGDDVLIGGFIPGNGVTKVVIRAIGPTLVNAGVPDPLQDPTLALVNGSGTTLATNDDWKTKADGSSQQAEIEATTIPPNDNRESALVASLAPGNYTAVVRGKNNTIGIAVVEVYNIP